MGRSKFMLAAVAMMMALVGCSSDDSNKKPVDSGPGTIDGVAVDGGQTDLGIELYDCEQPGQPCNAHNACAINPVCSSDKKCRPAAVQNCDDQLPCTEDICLGQGKCAHEPKKDTCALPVKKADGKGSELKCFAKDERDEACKVCDPDKDQYKWTAANGGACDDKDDCTKDDYCAEGVCKGTSYADQCQDTFSCTDDLCDGKGGCLGNPLRTDACLINGQCYQAKEKDADGCNVCDPQKSQSAWTSLSAHCLINAKCYQPGEKDATQCSVCDPAKNPSDWTPLPGLCKIDNQCFNKGDVNTSEGGCGECDPAASATSWTVKGDACYIDKECFKPSATDATGCGECASAKDKYGWSPVANTCLIEGKCYKPGDKDATGCGECDPVLNPAGWSVKGATCLIASVCYQPAELDDTGCGACDPAKSKSSFTPLSNKCLIGRKCFDDQGADETGCLQCVFATAPGVWSPAGATKVQNYDFEGNSAPGWAISNAIPAVGWNVSNRRPATGSYSLYYGDPALGNYDGNSTKNNGTATTPEITLGAGPKAGLRFWLWAEVEDGANYDKIEVDVVEGAAATTVWKKNVTDTVEKKVWTEIKIDLAAYAGKTIKITFRFDSVDSVSNKTEGVYVDDVTIYHSCQ